MDDIHIKTKEDIETINGILHDGQCYLHDISYEPDVFRLTIPLWRECLELPPHKVKRLLLFFAVKYWPHRKTELVLRNVKSMVIRGGKTRLLQITFDAISTSSAGEQLSISFCEGVDIDLGISRLEGVVRELPDVRYDFRSSWLGAAFPLRRKNSKREGT